MRRASAPQARPGALAGALDSRGRGLEPAAVPGTPTDGSSSTSAASVAAAALAVSAAAEKLRSVGPAVVAAAVAVAAPPEPALTTSRSAGSSGRRGLPVEPAATDETAPMTVDDGDRPRLKTMLSREMDLRAEVRSETGTRR